MQLKKEIKELQAKVDMIDSLINTTLNKVEKRIIELIFKEKYTKKQVAKEIYMSRANIYVILDNAIKKMDKKLKLDRN